MLCLHESKRLPGEYNRVEFCDDGRYEITCSYGHNTTTILELQKFEVLFDIGAHAILDGYYREAVSSFTSSIERFYEFAIRVMLESTGVSDELYIKTWKEVSNQSERQLGAFIFLWTSYLKENPQLLSTKQASFRNAVIHKGKIPTKEEAIEYGNEVLNLLRPKMQVLQERFPSSVEKIVSHSFCENPSTENQENPIFRFWMATIVNLKARANQLQCLSLREHLAHLDEFRQTNEKIIELFSEFQKNRKKS